MDGLDKMFDCTSSSSAFRTTPNNVPLRSPPKPTVPPVSPSKDAVAASCNRLEPPSASPTSSSASAPVSARRFGAARENVDDANGTSPSVPATRNCSPSSWAAVSDTSTIIASTSTCLRRTSSSRATWVSSDTNSGSALMISALLGSCRASRGPPFAPAPVLPWLGSVGRDCASSSRIGRTLAASAWLNLRTRVSRRSSEGTSSSRINRDA